jgi:Ca-activated chloride channel homolog
VLLTDGRNEIKHGIQDPEDLISVITAAGQPPVRVFTIAYGKDSDESDAQGRTVLQRISQATGATEFDAKDPTTISEVMADVISNF